MPDSRKPGNAEERALFRGSVSDVVPLPKQNKARLEPQRPKPIAAQRLRDNHEALQESLSDELPWDLGLEAGDELVYRRAGLPAQIMQRLRRGHWVIQDELDLHGMTSDEARTQVAAFLNDSVHEGFRCVRVIHGKGLRSKNREPVLKKKVAAWLMRRDEVLAFCQARITEGGSGAVVVLLKTKKNERPT
jgi:DNA-nicking Smr family endonuclease